MTQGLFKCYTACGLALIWIDQQGLEKEVVKPPMQYLELVLVGLGAGSWGTLIGAGGGFVIVPILFFMFPDKSAATITAISLVAVFFNGISAAQAYARQRRIDFGLGLLFLTATLPGAVLGALIVNYIPRGAFQLAFGSLLCVLAVYILLRPRKMVPAGVVSRSSPRRITDSRGNVYEYRVNKVAGLFINFAIGFAAGMLGVGGGIFNVPTFVMILGVPMQIATATSAFMLVGTSLASNVTNVIEGDLWGQWGLAAALTVGTIIGAQVGAWFSQRVGTLWVSRALALGLVVVGARLIWIGIG